MRLSDTPSSIDKSPSIRNLINNYLFIFFLSSPSLLTNNKHALLTATDKEYHWHMEMHTGKGTEKMMSIPSAYYQGRRRYRTTYNDKQSAPPDNDTQHNDLYPYDYALSKNYQPACMHHLRLTVFSFHFKLPFQISPPNITLSHMHLSYLYTTDHLRYHTLISRFEIFNCLNTRRTN